MGLVRPVSSSPTYQAIASLLRRYFIVVLLCSTLFLCGCIPSSNISSVKAPLTLTLWQGVNPPPNRDVLQKLVNQFNQSHPDIQVNSIYIGQPDQQMPKILAAVVGNASPDMLWFGPTLTGQLVELDAIRPIDEWLGQSPIKAEIDPALLPAMQYENHYWSIPFGTNNVGVFYRPSLFKASGVQALPKTWQDFRAVAQQLTQDTNGDGHIDRHGIQLPLGKGEFAVFTWLPFLWSNGGNLALTPSSNGSRVNIDQPEIIQALQFWQDLVKDGSAILSQPERGYELDNFLSGKVAMQISGPWTLGQLQQSGVDFGAFPMPTQKTPATSLGGEHLFLFKTTPERERAAFTFAEYVASAAFQSQWALGTGYLPTNLKSRNTPEYKAFLQKQPSLQVFLDQMPYAQARPIFPGYSRVSENLGRALESTIMGDHTPESAVQEAQNRIDLIFNPT